MDVHTIGIDLGKTVFHVVGLDSPGNVVLKRRPSRTQLLEQLANTPACLIGRSASSGFSSGRARASGTLDPRTVRAPLREI